MSKSDFNPTDVLVSPLADLISETGRAVAEAHKALGEANLDMFKNMPEALTNIGWTPSWFELSEVQAEISMAIHISESKKGEDAKGRRLRLFAAPSNAKYQSTYNYSAEGRSKVTLRFAAAPPPSALLPNIEE